MRRVFLGVLSVQSGDDSRRGEAGEAMEGVEREAEAATTGGTEAESSAGISSGFKPNMSSLYDNDFGRALGARGFCAGFLSLRSGGPGFSDEEAVDDVDEEEEEEGERASASLERSLGLFETGEEEAASARGSVGTRDTVRDGGLGAVWVGAWVLAGETGGA